MFKEAGTGDDQPAEDKLLAFFPKEGRGEHAEHEECIIADVLVHLEFPRKGLSMEPHIALGKHVGDILETLPGCVPDFVEIVGADEFAEDLFFNISFDPRFFRRVHPEPEIEGLSKQLSQGMIGIDLYLSHHTFISSLLDEKTYRQGIFYPERDDESNMPKE